MHLVGLISLLYADELFTLWSSSPGIVENCVRMCYLCSSRVCGFVVHTLNFKRPHKKRVTRSSIRGIKGPQLRLIRGHLSCVAFFPLKTGVELQLSTIREFYVLLTVHPCTIRYIKPTWCTMFIMFISFLYTFRANMCPSSGEITVSMRHLVFVTLCGWLSGMQGDSTVHTR